MVDYNVILPPPKFKIFQLNNKKRTKFAGHVKLCEKWRVTIASGLHYHSETIANFRHQNIKSISEFNIEII